MRIRTPHALGALALSTLAVSIGGAEPARTLTLRGPEAMLAGDPESAAIDAQGRLGPGLQLEELTAAPGSPVLGLAVSPAGEVFAATAGEGVLRLGRQGASVLDAQGKRAVTAIAFAGGRVLAASGPDAGIASIAAGGGAAGAPGPVLKPGARYAWAILPDGPGLVVATGEPGRVVALSPAGKVDVLFEPGEAHVRALLRHPRLGLVAGGGQRGIVYQVEAGRGRALYDSDLEEVTALALDPSTGDVYAAVVSASQPSSGLVERTIGPTRGEASDAEGAPFRGSEVVRIAEDGHVDVLWSSRTEGALALAFDPGARRVLFTTGTGARGHARLYAIDPAARDRLVLVARLEPRMAPALAISPSSGALLVGTAPSGRVFAVGPALRPRSVYVSAEQDLGRVSAIGRVRFDPAPPPGARVEVSVRTGNTREADATWSAWSDPVTDAAGGPVQVPRGRFVQLRAALAAPGAGAAAPWLSGLELSMARRNLAPALREVFLLRRGVYLAAYPREEEKERTLSMGRGVIEELRAGEARQEDRLRVRQGSQPGMLTASWFADDPDGDPLLFRVELARVDAPAPRWVEVARGLEASFFTFDARGYPDGRYAVRVHATDRPGNAPGEALGDQLESAPFLVDHTPPRLDALLATPRGASVRVEARASDATSRVAQALLSIDGGPWVSLPGADGILDAGEEALRVDIPVDGGADGPRLERGKHGVVVRVVDEAGNEASASATFDLR